MNDEQLQEIHDLLDTAETGLRDLARRVKTDSKAGKVSLREYADWAATPPDIRLDRARGRLDQEFYRVGIAGMFSSGKSTIINALLDEPDLLPTAASVCTLTRTILRAPEPGSNERVEVQYLTRDEAIRNIIRNPKFDGVFDADDKARGESGTVSVDDIQNAIRRCQEGDRETQALGAELREFVDALGIHEARLGRVHTVPLTEKDQYLRTTAVEEDGVTRLVGIGHIRCIAHAIIYMNSPLFTEDNIELMDLPGTDDPDPTQKQVTYDAIKTIDVLISALFGSSGLREEDLAILDDMVNHHAAVTEKTFFAGNRMDDLKSENITNAALEGLVSDGIIKHLTTRGFDANKVFLVSARYGELLSQERQRRHLSDDEQATLDGMRQHCDTLLGKLKSGDIRPELRERLEPAYEDGGVVKLRDKLIDYLKHDIKTTHLREVENDLGEVAKGLNKLLDPERGDSWDLDTDESALQGFLDDADDQLQNILLTFEEGLEKAFPQMVVKLREYVEDQVKNLLARDNKAINFRRIRADLPSQGIYQVQSAVIIKAREEVGKAVTQLIAGQLAKAVAGQVLTKLEALEPKDALTRIDAQLETDFADRYAAMVDGFESGLRRAAELRVHEEVVGLRQDIPDARPSQGEWSSDIEESFRVDLTKLINEKLATRIGRFDKVLPVHFKLVSQELRDGLRNLFLEVGKKGAPRDDLEVPTLAGMNLDPAEERRRALKGYLRTYDQAHDALGKATAELKVLAS